MIPLLLLLVSAPVKLAWVPPTISFPTATCTASRVETLANTGQVVPVTGARVLSLNRGPASLTFYTDSACAHPAASFTFAAGTSSLTFYERAAASGSFSVRAQIPGLEPAYQHETVTSPITGGGGTGPASPPTSSPAQASAAGYTRLVFDDEFNSGPLNAQWYNTNFFSASATLPASGWTIDPTGYLRILTDNSGYSDGLATADPTHTSGAWQHGYFEASIRFDPRGHSTGAWPAFWSYSLEGALGQVATGSFFGELDFLECYPQSVPCTYITTVHQWQAESSNVSVASNSNNVPAVPGGTDFTKFHTYGCLWTPDQVEWYFDNRLVTTVATGPGTPFTGIEGDHMLIILGTGKNWPMDVDFVHVWQ